MTTNAAVNRARHQYAHRPDGLLSAATKGASAVVFERDVIGRIIKESQGEHSIVSRWDARDLLGAEPPVGAQTPESLFSARFERDRLGLEIERALPGGVQARWQRDRHGRPLRHEISSFRQGRVRDSRYTWGPNDRLQSVVDSLGGGPVQYAHDAVGNLSAAKYEDGRHTSSKLWWSRDTAGHGGSAFKVFKEKGNDLVWFRDADEYGNFINPEN